MTAIAEITVQDFAQRQQADSDQPIQLVDVRETAELELAALPGFTHLPLSQAQTWAPQIHDVLDAEVETIVMCHHGMRSAQMCAWLRDQGFTQVKNLVGGIDAYSCLVDRSVPRY